MSKKGLNKLIFKYVLEIVMAVVLVVFSYNTFTNTGLSESAAVAKNYSENDYSIQMMYNRNENIYNDILAYSDLLDKGVLTLRNPNSATKSVQVNLVFDGNVNYLKNLKAEFNGKSVDLSNYTVENDKYIISLGTVEIGSYQEVDAVFSLYGDPLFGTDFTFSFDCSESFYL